MHANPRPPATQQEAMWAMDRLIAAHLFGQQEMAQVMGLNVTDVTCFGFVLEAGDDLLTAGELAERVNVTTGAMTGVLNRLERVASSPAVPTPPTAAASAWPRSPTRWPWRAGSTSRTTPASPSCSRTTRPRSWPC